MDVKVCLSNKIDIAAVGDIFSGQNSIDRVKQTDYFVDHIVTFLSCIFGAI